jgi:transcriptional regulator with XRE-family HTH domain
MIAKIKEFRKEKKLTQTAMAERLALSQNAYNKIETGKTAVKAEVLQKIAKILDKDIKEFLEVEPSFPNSISYNVEQNNAPNSVGHVAKEVVYNQSDFEKERDVWQALERSLREVIASKDEIIQSKNELIALLTKK